jgi:hypothetical protein
VTGRPAGDFETIARRYAALPQPANPRQLASPVRAVISKEPHERSTREPDQTERGEPMKFMIPLLVAALPVAAVAQSQSGQAPGASAGALPKTTEVMVILTARQGVTRQQIMAVMPSEVRETVKLYLDGKIRQWYSRSDGRGAVFLIDAKTQDEARAVMETLPLSKEHLMDHEYIPVGPLVPLAGLLGPGAQQ